MRAAASVAFEELALVCLRIIVSSQRTCINFILMSLSRKIRSGPRQGPSSSDLAGLIWDGQPVIFRISCRILCFDECTTPIALVGFQSPEPGVTAEMVHRRPGFSYL